MILSRMKRWGKPQSRSDVEDACNFTREDAFYKRAAYNFTRDLRCNILMWTVRRNLWVKWMENEF